MLPNGASSEYVGTGTLQEEVFSSSSIAPLSHLLLLRPRRHQRQPRKLELLLVRGHGRVHPHLDGWLGDVLVQRGQQPGLGQRRHERSCPRRRVGHVGDLRHVHGDGNNNERLPTTRGPGPDRDGCDHDILVPRNAPLDAGYFPDHKVCMVSFFFKMSAGFHWNDCLLCPFLP